VSSDPAVESLPTTAEIVAVAESTGLVGAETLTWSMQPMSHESIIDTTGGLYEVLAYAPDAADSLAWSCVVKVLQRSEGDECDAPESWCYWRREAAFYASDLPASLPASLRVPVPYAVTDRPTSSWVWMERSSGETIQRWTPEDYHRVAVAAGQAGATHLARERPLSRPWLVPGFLRSLLADGGFWAGFLSRDSAESAWKTTIVQESFDRVANERFDRLWGERDDLLAALGQLPQVLCHNDFHRRNVLLPKDVTRSPIAVDWAFAGTGAIATDAALLTAGTLYFCDVPVAQAAELDATVFDGYLEGLRRAGWDGDQRLIRCGFAATIALWQATTLPGWVAMMLPADAGVNVERLFGAPANDVRDAWVELHEFALERADEAEALRRGLGLG
jgi:hypothetical protein